MKANVYKYHHLVDGYALYSFAFLLLLFISSPSLSNSRAKRVSGANKRVEKRLWEMTNFSHCAFYEANEKRKKPFPTPAFRIVQREKSSSSTEYLFDILGEANNS